MAKRKPGRRPDYVQNASPARKRSYEAPLLALGAALLIGYPLVQNATADRMRRNTYANSSSCACAYSVADCTVSNGRWVGPWYAVSAEDRDAADPGEGRQCDATRSSGGSGAYLYGNSGNYDDVRPRTGVESGYRGGFGANGRIRAAGS